MLLVNYRPEYRHQWGSRGHYTQIRLAPLPLERTHELLRLLLGSDASLEPLQRLLIARTDGNPFFLEESIRDLVETGALVGAPGAYRLTRPLETVEIPATIQAVLAARIDRLPANDKLVLQSAAVIGKDVPFVLLKSIVALPDELFRQSLANLEASELLYETRRFPDVEYTLRHALTHDVAYGTLLHSRRRALHADITRAIEAIDAEGRGDQVERLAHHALRGELWEKALLYLRQAGARAVALSANRQAVTYFEQALGVLTRLPEDRHTLEQAIDLRIDLRDALLPLGVPAGMLDHIQSAERTAKALGDPARIGWVSTMMAHYFWRTGEQDRAIELAERALALSDAGSDLALKVSAKYYVGLAHHALGHYDLAMRVLADNLALLQGDLLLERFGMSGLPSVFCRKWWAWCAAETGNFAEGLAQASEGLRVAETADHPYSVIFACRGISHIHQAQGDVDRAIAMLERALTLCQTLGFPGILAGVAPSLGQAYVLRGRTEEGLALLESSVSEAEASRLMFSLSLWISHLAGAYLAAGRIEDAWEAGLRALDMARKCAERGHEAWALRQLAEVASDPRSTAKGEAEGLYGAALAVADELRMRPLTGRCLLGLGVLLRSQGRRDAARERMENAAQLFRALQMSSHLARAERELHML
jgi:tetratricopeptide (TPR) repeat protein